MSNQKSTGNLINKLETAIALAVMRGDKEAEAKFTKALEMALNSTDAAAFIG
jgi:BMFP domain-containing protein YqiC